MKITETLYHGMINKDLQIRYYYTFEKDGQYQTIKEYNTGAYSIHNSFVLIISMGYGKPSITIPSNKYYAFIDLFEKAVKLINDNMYNLYPNIDPHNFEVDSHTMNLFKTEKALFTQGYTICPSSYTNTENETYPAIEVSNVNNVFVKIPYEDALCINKMFNRFCPITFGNGLLSMMGRFD